MQFQLAKPGVRDFLSLAFVLTVSVGGIFVRQIGIALAVLMVTAVVLTIRSPKPRVFCTSVCPRGRALGFVLGPLSLRLAFPRFLSQRPFRRFLCGFMMFCVTMSLFRATPGVSAFAWAGTVFWALCLVSLTGGIVLGLLFKPRAWCTICPLGTLQDTIREGREGQAV